ncbi:MAG: AraC family transcriptional regulator [Lachnospiraceae bacterium]|nr:AraC family transcriptional regulator [Lachnospiraceae bacterium]
MRINKTDFEQYISNYEEDEIIYRTIHHLRQTSPNELTLYLKSIPRNLIETRHLLVPELVTLPGTPVKVTANSLAPSSVNILLSKHNRFTPGYLHEHDFFEAAYVYSGAVPTLIQGKRHTLQTGDICIIPPNTLHSVEIFDDSILINIIIRHSVFQSTFWELLSADTVLSNFFSHVLFQQTKGNYLLFHTEKDAQIRDIVEDMYIEYFNHEKYKDLRLQNLLMNLWIFLLRNHEEDNVAVITANNTSFSVSSILEYINKNYQTVSLSSISEHFGFSPTHLSTLIKKYTGQTFIQIVRAIKLQKATQALSYTNLTVNELCEIIGYKSPEHFMRIFKKEYNMTPSEYRQLHQLQWDKSEENSYEYESSQNITRGINFSSK